MYRLVDSFDPGAKNGYASFHAETGWCDVTTGSSSWFQEVETGLGRTDSVTGGAGLS